MLSLQRIYQIRKASLLLGLIPTMVLAFDFVKHSQMFTGEMNIPEKVIVALIVARYAGTWICFIQSQQHPNYQKLVIFCYFILVAGMTSAVDMYNPLIDLGQRPMEKPLNPGQNGVFEFWHSYGYRYTTPRRSSPPWGLDQ